MRTGVLAAISITASAAVLTAGVSAYAIGTPQADSAGQPVDIAPVIVGDWVPLEFDAALSHPAAVVVSAPAAIELRAPDSGQQTPDAGGPAPEGEPGNPVTGNQGEESSGNPNAGNPGNNGEESSGNPNAGNPGNNGEESSGNPNAGNPGNNGEESSGNPNAGNPGNNGNGNSGNGNSGKSGKQD